MMIQSISPTLYFRGRKATEIAAHSHQRADGLFRLLKNDDDPYIGESPELLRTQTNMPENQLRRILDALANQLRKRPHNSRSVLRKCMEAETQAASVPIRKIGEGRMGRVYKIGSSPDAFALKVFRNPEESISEEGELVAAPFQEAANGLFLTHRNTKNVSRFYLANPFQGWTLTEYIGKRDKLENRSGQTLKEQGLFLDDTGNDKNFVNGIRVDHGDRLIDQSKCPSNIYWVG